MSIDRDIAGLAALAISESLLLTLTEGAILGHAAVRDLLTDAAEAHRGEAPGSADPEMHERVAALIERVRARRNGVAQPPA